MIDLKHALEESHKDLHQWFLMHQECLLLGHDKYSDLAFVAFSRLLNMHLSFENEFLLLDEAGMRWPLKVYIKEHEKLLILLERLTERLQSFYQLDGRKKRLALLEILDVENTFLHVMEHHEQREEQDLFLQLPKSRSLFDHWQACENNMVAISADKETLKVYLSQAI